MKTTILSVLLLGCVLPALAVERTELDNEIHSLGAKLEALQAQPDKRIPEDILHRAQAVILMNRAKAGGLTTYEGGGGVAMVRNPTNGVWSPAAFAGADAAKLGLKLGSERSFFVVLLMNTNATRLLIDPAYEFGAETPPHGSAAVPANNAGVAAEQSVLVYDDQQGYLGATGVQSGAFMANDEANGIYYGKPVTLRNVLFDHQVKPTAAALDLATKVTGRSAAPVVTE